MGMTYKQLVHRIIKSLRRVDNNELADQLEQGDLKLHVKKEVFIAADATNDELVGYIDRGEIWLEVK